MGTIRAIRVRVGEDPVEVEIGSGLESLQKEVGGYVELVSLAPRIDAYVNEEGLRLKLPPNRVLAGRYGGEHPVVGNVVVVSHDDEGDTIGLTEPQIREWIPRISKMPRWGLLSVPESP